MSDTLPWSRRLGYGIGDFAFNLFFTTATLYLLFYYTDVLGLPPQVAGWVFALPMIWDAIADPVMGYLASRTRSRWGRYRPYLLFGSIPLALSWAAMFAPTGLRGGALVAFALATHLLFRTLYTIVSMPYLSLSAVMTTSSGERGVLAGVRMIAATSAGLLVALATPGLAHGLGGGDEARGYALVMAIYAALAAVILLCVFAATREAVGEIQTMPSVRSIIAMLRCNAPFWLIAGMLLFSSMASTLFGKTVPYLLKYDLHRPELIGPALGLLTFMALLSIPLWSLLMRRTSKRAVALAGIGVSIVGWAAFLLAGRDLPALFVCLALLGVGGGAGAMTFWAMIPDTVEFGEFRSGERAEGIVFGIISFVQKAALGLSVGVLGELLAWIGYVPGQAQSPATLAGMRTLMTLGPIACALVAGLFLWFYPLDWALHRRLVRVLERRARSPSQAVAGA